nr:hypothetical protein BaRGS_022715 [Batillaria attramentaria]
MSWNKARSFVLFLIFAVTLRVTFSIPPDYARVRRALIDAELAMQIGGNGSDLSPLEQKLNGVMLDEKKKIVEAARVNGSYFPAGYDFLSSRAAMETTMSFKIIQQMPKGGVLHVHDMSLTSIDWLIQNVTYRDNLYMCVDKHYSVKFHFYSSPPSNPGCPWKLVQTYRKECGDPKVFDKLLHSNITMVTDDPAKAYPDIDAVWDKFTAYFGKVSGLMLYAPVFEDYLYEGLKQFRQDNVQYLEIRALLSPVYELNGTTHDLEWVLDVYQRVITQFVKDYPDFSGGKIIFSGHRSSSGSVVLADVKEAMILHQKYPTFMVGFDLVGQEDRFHSLIYYIDDLLYPSQQNPPVHLPYFFHAGETDWQDTATDYNLMDALLLNATRIGHGYALYKHPLLLQKIKQRQIPVEVNPISNQVLKLVDDLRNHPAASLIADNFPLVISSDDPASWEAAPLTDDFYVTFMALTGEEAGLATLKQLAKNSIWYSAMTMAEKKAAFSLWERKWDVFIKNTAKQLGLLRDRHVFAEY